MADSSRRVLWVFAWVVLAAGAGIGLVCFLGVPTNRPTATQPTKLAQTQSLTTSTTQSASKPAPMQTYGQLLHADFRHYPDTQPWAFPVDLEDAAHLVIDDPVYVCPRGDLWITRHGADPLPEVLARASTENEHLIDRQVRFILWTSDRQGWQAAAVCKSGDGFDLVSATNRQKIPGSANYHWESAINWDDNGKNRILVPTGDGIAIITTGSELTIQLHDLRDHVGEPVHGISTQVATTQGGDAPATIASIAATQGDADASASAARPQMVFDLRGLLAWIPADAVAPTGKQRVARYVDGAWADLDPAQWPGDGIIHLVPMLDGTVLQIRRGEQPGAVQLKIVPLDLPRIDKDKITELVTQLNDDEADKRVAATARLNEFGPGIFPILERKLPDAPPEAAARIRQILDSKMTTKLGGIIVNDDQLTVKTRLTAGGVLFFAPRGLTIPQGQDEPLVEVPAYLVIRPGHPVEEALGELIHDIDLDTQIDVVRDEWIVSTPTHGPRRVVPPRQLADVLKDSEKSFTRVSAIDSRGRWILHPDNPPLANSPTLIIDPTVPDPTPRLALWMIDSGDDAGWSNGDWPALSREPSQWVLGERDWHLLDDAMDKLNTEPPVLNAGPLLTAGASTTRATTSPPPTTSIAADIRATPQASTLESVAMLDGPPLFIDSAGNQIFDGKQTLTVVTPNGQRRVWNLPESCQSTEENRAWLVADRDQRLYLFNALGRIIRLGYAPEAAVPFVLEAIFDKDVPFFHAIRRAWTDPAGRIAIAYDQSHLVLIFPTGQIPHEISDQILGQDLRRTEAPIAP